MPHSAAYPDKDESLTRPLEDLSFKEFFAAADAMLLVDMHGRILQASNAACAVLEYAPEDIIGLKVEALVPERYREQHHKHREGYVADPMKRAMGNGRNLVALTREGREIQLDIGLSPLLIKKRHYILITFHDSDQRLKAEEALRTSEERLRLAKRVAGLGVFDYDLIRNTMKYDECVRQLWGIRPDQPMTYEMLIAGIHPEDRHIRRDAIHRASDPEGSGEYKIEYRVVNAIDGRQRWVAAIGKVFFQDKRPQRMVGVVQEITERKLLEQKLRDQRNEMGALIKTQVALQTASAIAHELNQPLTALSAYSEVGLHIIEHPPVDSDQLRRALLGAVAQAQRAGDSLHELLEFLQHGEFAREAVDLNALIEDALDIVHHDGYREFQAILELEPGLPPVMANPMQIQKVLVNLLCNSVEAMRSANIPEAAIRIRLSTNTETSQAQITVQDNGPGLTGEVAQRLFEPFFTTKAKGIGMGLVISRALVESNGGQMWLETDHQTGATFHFTLPFAA
jgi:PAS domain S-box-containing protein